MSTETGCSPRTVDSAPTATQDLALTYGPPLSMTRLNDDHGVAQKRKAEEAVAQEAAAELEAAAEEARRETRRVRRRMRFKLSCEGCQWQRDQGGHPSQSRHMAYGGCLSADCLDADSSVSSSEEE